MVNLYFFIDFILHADKYVNIIIQNFGIYSYLMLFLIIFLETGFVITPFLPGDSLLFIIGTFCAKGSLNLPLVLFFLILAAILGDSLNYFIGNFFGEKIFSKNRFFKKEHLEKTKLFYKKHGGKTIIIARFIPIVRTFAPFVAGIGKMDYRKFLSYNIIGGIAWVVLLVLSGYYFGRLEFIEKNLTLVIYSIIFISFIPLFLEFLRSKRRKVK